MQPPEYIGLFNCCPLSPQRSSSCLTECKILRRDGLTASRGSLVPQCSRDPQAVMRPPLPLVPFLPSPRIAPAEMTASLPGHDIMVLVLAAPASRGSATLTALRPDPPQAMTVMAGYIGPLPPRLLPSYRAASEGGLLRVSIPQQVACVSHDLLDICQ